MTRFCEGYSWAHNAIVREMHRYQNKGRLFNPRWYYDYFIQHESLREMNGQDVVDCQISLRNTEGWEPEIVRDLSLPTRELVMQWIEEG